VVSNVICAYPNKSDGDSTSKHNPEYILMISNLKFEQIPANFALYTAFYEQERLYHVSLEMHSQTAQWFFNVFCCPLVYIQETHMF